MPLTRELIDEAIVKIATSGQSFTLPDGTSVTRADIPKLQNLREQLLSEERSQSEEGMYRPISFGRPS